MADIYLDYIKEAKKERGDGFSDLKVQSVAVQSTYGLWFMIKGSWLMVEADGKQAEAHDPENSSRDVERDERETGRESSSETCICIRGHFEEYFYDENGNLTDTIDMVPGGLVLNIEKGQWHSLKCLESGTVLFEAKDGAYRSLAPDEVMEV